MSVYVTTSLWEHSPHKGSDLLLLLAMADQTRDEGLCWLTVDSLARRTRMDRATVQRRLRELEKSEAIICVVEAHGRTNRTYWINTPSTARYDPRARETPETETPETETPQPSEKQPKRGGRLCPVCAEQHRPGEVCEGATPANIDALRNALRRKGED